VELQLHVLQDSWRGAESLRGLGGPAPPKKKIKILPQILLFFLILVLNFFFFQFDPKLELAPPLLLAMGFLHILLPNYS